MNYHIYINIYTNIKTGVELKCNINYQNYLNGYVHKQKYVHICDTFASIEFRPGNTYRINRLASIPVCNSYEPVARQTSMKENVLKTGK